MPPARVRAAAPREDAKRNRWLGSLILRQPLSHWALTWIAIGTVAITVAFLYVGEYARKARVEGRLVDISTAAQGAAGDSAGLEAELMVPESLLAAAVVGSEDLDMGRIRDAAQAAAVHDDILRMPMQYQTLIGDMGAALSGGQKQRIILARALYKCRSILFLDEATSHLDLDSERAVNEAVKRLRLTKILIAHRPETIASADRVLVMADGRIEREYRPAERALRLVGDADIEPGHLSFQQDQRLA